MLISKRRLGGLVVLMTGLVACHSTSDHAAATPIPTPTEVSPTPSPAAPEPVQIEMKNVRLHLAPGIVLKVRQLRGEMVSKVAGAGPVFDNQRSYVLRVFSGDATMDMTSLTNLMNNHAFAWEDAPI